MDLRRPVAATGPPDPDRTSGQPFDGLGFGLVTVTRTTALLSEPAPGTDATSRQLAVAPGRRVTLRPPVVVDLVTIVAHGWCGS